jgi:hypothetical protein
MFFPLIFLRPLNFLLIVFMINFLQISFKNVKLEASFTMFKTHPREAMSFPKNYRPVIYGTIALDW